MSLLDPEVTYEDDILAPDTPDVVRGRESIGAIWQPWDAHDEFGAEIYEYIDAHPWVICDTGWYGKGRRSGPAIDLRQADAYEFDAGKIVRPVLAHPDTAAAHEAVGKTE